MDTEKYFSLQDRVMVVTGGAAGVGRATAERFKASGAQVIVFDIDSQLEDAVAEMGVDGERVDVGDEQSMRTALNRVAERFGRIDGLVNNAGVFSVNNIVDSTTAEWEKCFRVNTLAVSYGIKYASSHMNPGSTIVNVASVAAIMSTPGYAAYSASKSAVCSLTQAAALELSQQGIRVNALCPGSVDTPMLRSQPNVDEEIAMNIAASPIRRIIQPEEVAALIHFLSAPDCGAVNGAIVPVEGGMSIGITQSLMESAVASHA